jgi:hypothetical protein
MMQFVKTDDDAYTVLTNLDGIKRIGDAFEVMGEYVDLDSRDEALGQGFKSAYARLSEPADSGE